jgi:DNA helicase-2/ATP-dependent DNA helicase PcrA
MRYGAGAAIVERSPILTEQQKALAEAADGAYLVVAPPGSGKTEVLVQRVIHLLRSSPGETFRILALTFTNKAAESLRARVLQAAGGEEWRVFAGTFHAFCLELLQTYGEPVGVTAQTTIMESDDDRIDVLQKALDDSGYDVEGMTLETWRRVLTEIDRLKWTLVPADAAPDRVVSGTTITLRAAYSAYEELLQSYGAIDFSGMLLRANTLLAQEPWVVEHYQSIYRYVVVDEAQDLNFAQYELLKRLLAVPKPNVMFVGDRNQAIYRFAGASPKFLDAFVRDFGADEVALTTNFRSAQAIVEAANKLSSHIVHGTRQLRPMLSEAGAEGSVGAWEYPSEKDEAAGVAGWVTQLLKEGLATEWLHQDEDSHVSPEDICILGRTRYALGNIAPTLEQAGVQYVMRTGERGLFDSQAGQLLYLALRIVANERDVPSLRRLGKMLAPGDGADDIEFDSSEIVRHLRTSPKLPSGVAEVLSGLASGRAVEASIPSILSTDFEPASPVAQEEAELWLADREELARQWHNYLMKIQEPVRTVQAFLRFLSYSQRVSLDDPGVRVLTVHAAKGLEFRAVVLVGMNDGMFPYYLSLSDPEELDDERRNAYVAISRSARVLRLTRARSRQTRYGLRQEQPSRFVAEMGLTFERPSLDGR